MWKIIRLLIFIIWLIDVLNINFIINGVAVIDAEFLDKTLPLNFWFWFLYVLIAPDAD